MTTERIKELILVRLRRGEVDSEKFTRWLIDSGLPSEQAEEVLDELMNQVLEENDEV